MLTNLTLTPDLVGRRVKIVDWEHARFIAGYLGRVALGETPRGTMTREKRKYRRARWAVMRAQVGLSQCQQTYAAVAMLSRRSTKSKLIIEMPRCVSHSSQAFRHAFLVKFRRFGGLIGRKGHGGIIGEEEGG